MPPRGSAIASRRESPDPAPSLKVRRRLRYELLGGTDARSRNRSPWYRNATRFHALIGAVALLVLTAAADRALNRRQTAPAQMYRHAIGLVNAKSTARDLSTAVDELGTVLHMEPNNLAALGARLDTLLRIFDSTGEAQRLREASDLLASRASARLDPVQRVLYQVRIDVAANRYSDVIGRFAADPALLAYSAEANRLLGRAMEASGRLKDALPYYHAAVRLSPDSWLAHNDLAAALHASGNPEEARRHFLDVMRLNPDSAAGYSNLGVVLLEAGELEAAQQTFEMALDRRPAPETYFNLGITHYYARRYASAIPYFESALQVRPESDEYMTARGDAQWQAGSKAAACESFSAALATLDRREKTRPLRAVELCRRALCFARLRDFRSAEEALTQAAERDPEEEMVYYTGAVADVLQGHTTAARKQIEMAISRGYPEGLAKVDPDLRELF